MAGRVFQRHQLLISNCGVSVALSGLGDYIQQRWETRAQHVSVSGVTKAPTINWRRTANMSTSFGLTAGLLCHHWYHVLDRLLPGRSLRTVVVKIAWDQVLFSPVCIAACISVSGAVFEGKAPRQILQDTLHLGSRLWLSEWFIWPPAQFVNFYFLPTRYRVLYDNLVSLGYDWYTSRLKHGKEASEEGKEASSREEGEKAGRSEEVAGSSEMEVGRTRASSRGERYLTLEWSLDHSDMGNLVSEHS